MTSHNLDLDNGTADIFDNNSERRCLIVKERKLLTFLGNFHKIDIPWQ